MRSCQNNWLLSDSFLNCSATDLCLTNHRSQNQRTFSIGRNIKRSQSGWPSMRISFVSSAKSSHANLWKWYLIDVFPHLLELVNWNQKLVCKSQHKRRRKFEFKSFSDPKFHCFVDRTFHFNLIDTYWCNLVCARQFLSYCFHLLYGMFVGEFRS